MVQRVACGGGGKDAMGALRESETRPSLEAARRAAALPAAACLVLHTARSVCDYEMGFFKRQDLWPWQLEGGRRQPETRLQSGV